MQRLKERIDSIFRNAGADVIFLMNTSHHDSNFTYMTGFTSGDFEYNTLIVTKRGMVLPVSELEYEIAMEQRPSNMSVVKIDSRKQLGDILKKHIKSKVVGVNGSFLPYLSYKNLKKLAKPKEVIDVSKAFHDARSVKYAYEIGKIRKANSISKDSLEELKPELKAGMSEKELAGRLEYFMRKRGSGGTAFKTIVSFNGNAALPHHMPDNTKLAPNSIVLIDFGATFNNYCADVTRTFMFKPEKSSQRHKRFTEMHSIVSQAQHMALEAIKEGVTGESVHIIAANYIDKAKGGKYRGTFIHSLGHSIGLDVHDMGPGLGYGVKDRLKANMVVSDEPGIYVVGFGGVRIEDDVIVTKSGAKML
ncbi:MAG: M24 family metallopeptidase [Candidatus Micrarchaeaceae archaeon]